MAEVSIAYRTPAEECQCASFSFSLALCPFFFLCFPFSLPCAFPSFFPFLFLLPFSFQSLFVFPFPHIFPILALTFPSFPAVLESTEPDVPKPPLINDKEYRNNIKRKVYERPDPPGSCPRTWQNAGTSSRTHGKAQDEIWRARAVQDSIHGKRVVGREVPDQEGAAVDDLRLFN